MIRFLISLLAPLQLRLLQEARSTFLKDPEALRIHYGDQDQEQEEERDGEETVANGENLGLGQEDFQEEEEDCDFVPPPHSPRNSIESSKSVRIWGRSYQSQKERINKMITDLEANPDKFHSEKLEKQATLLSSMLGISTLMK